MCNNDETNISFQKKRQETQEEVERIEEMLKRTKRQEEDFFESCRSYAQKLSAIPYYYQGMQAERCIMQMNDGLERGRVQIQNHLDEQRENLVRQRNACQEKMDEYMRSGQP